MADAMLSKTEKEKAPKRGSNKSENNKQDPKTTKKVEHRRKFSVSKSPNDDITIETEKERAGSASGSSQDSVKGSNGHTLGLTNKQKDKNDKDKSDKTKDDEEPSLKSISEVLSLLRAEQISQRDKIDELYNQDYYSQDYDDYDPNYYEQYEGDDDQVDDVPENEANDEGHGQEPDQQSEKSDEPPTKKQKTTEGAAASVFREASSSFKNKEILDKKVSDDLAEMVNSFFREGISDEKFSELMKETHRPENCVALTKTRVNQLIWDLLRPHTRAQDNTIQHHQNTVIKASCKVVKMLNTLQQIQENQPDLEGIQECIDNGVDSLALLGQYNKITNNKRKDNQKYDLLQEYSHLSSQSLPYTDKLYGDDISKNVKEIQDVNRVRGRLSYGTPVHHHGGSGRGNYAYVPPHIRGFGGFGVRGRGSFPLRFMRGGRIRRPGGARGGRGNRGGRSRGNFYPAQNSKNFYSQN